MIKDIIKEITKKHHYKITSEYWGRVGVMCNRYGEDVLMEAVSSVPSKEMPLTDCLNRIERKCQVVLENDNDEDIDTDIFDMFGEED